MEGEAAGLTQTTLPYWDLLPLDRDPEGGWTTVRMEELDLVIQIPSVYQTGSCGGIFTADKVRSKDQVADAYRARLVGFEGGTIRIHVYSDWGEDLDRLVTEGEVPSGSPLVTPVERFSLGGIPAVRYISTNPDQIMLIYGTRGPQLEGIGQLSAA